MQNGKKQIIKKTLLSKKDAQSANHPVWFKKETVNYASDTKKKQNVLMATHWFNTENVTLDKLYHYYQYIKGYYAKSTPIKGNLEL